MLTRSVSHADRGSDHHRKNFRLSAQLRWSFECEVALRWYRIKEELFASRELMYEAAVKAQRLILGHIVRPSKQEWLKIDTDYAFQSAILYQTIKDFVRDVKPCIECSNQANDDATHLLGELCSQIKETILFQKNKKAFIYNAIFEVHLAATQYNFLPTAIKVFSFFGDLENERIINEYFRVTILTRYFPMTFFTLRHLDHFSLTNDREIFVSREEFKDKEKAILTAFDIDQIWFDPWWARVCIYHSAQQYWSTLSRYCTAYFDNHIVHLRDMQESLYMDRFTLTALNDTAFWLMHEQVIQKHLSAKTYTLFMTGGYDLFDFCKLFFDAKNEIQLCMDDEDHAIKKILYPRQVLLKLIAELEGAHMVISMEEFLPKRPDYYQQMYEIETKKMKKCFSCDSSFISAASNEDQSTQGQLMFASNSTSSVDSVEEAVEMLRAQLERTQSAGLLLSRSSLEALLDRASTDSVHGSNHLDTYSSFLIFEDTSSMSSDEEWFKLHEHDANQDEFGFFVHT